MRGYGQLYCEDDVDVRELPCCFPLLLGVGCFSSCAARLTAPKICPINEARRSWGLISTVGQVATANG